MKTLRTKSYKQAAAIIGGGILLVLGLGYGWVANIIALANAEHVGGLEILRVAGIFIAPLGIVLGWFV